MRELGLEPGPRVGEALAALLEIVLDRPERNRPELLRDALRAWASTRADITPKA
jgi:hypothetical protein